MIILGIETSCDETSASILKNGTILSNVVHSQIEHIKFGGVVPELASKNHEKLICSIVDKAIIDSKINIRLDKLLFVEIVLYCLLIPLLHLKLRLLLVKPGVFFLVLHQLDFH